MEKKKIFVIINENGEELDKPRFQLINDTLFTLYPEDNFISMPYNPSGFFWNDKYYTLEENEELSLYYNNAFINWENVENNNFKIRYKTNSDETCLGCNDNSDGYYYVNNTEQKLCLNCAASKSFNHIISDGNGYLGFTDHVTVVEYNELFYNSSYFDNHFRGCNSCNLIFHSDHLTITRDGFICETCLSADYSQCDSCNRWANDNTFEFCRSYNDGETEVCSVCRDRFNSETIQTSTNSTSARIHSYHSGNIIWHPQRTDECQIGDTMFGFELEVEMRDGVAQDTAARIIQGAFNDINHEIWLSADSSINGNGGFEIITNPMTLPFWNTHPEILQVFHGFNKMVKAYHGEGCGMHIHISKNAITDSNHMERLLNFMSDGKEMVEIIAQRKPNNYWQHVPKENIPELKEMPRSDNHYEGVSIKRDTVEFRIFRPNLLPHRINKNIQSVYAFIEYAKENDDVFGFLDFVKANKNIYPDLYKYMEKIFRVPGAQIDLVEELLEMEEA